VKGLSRFLPLRDSQSGWDRCVGTTSLCLVTCTLVITQASEQQPQVRVVSPKTPYPLTSREWCPAMQVVYLLKHWDGGLYPKTTLWAISLTLYYHHLHDSIPLPVSEEGLCVCVIWVKRPFKPHNLRDLCFYVTKSLNDEMYQVKGTIPPEMLYHWSASHQAGHVGWYTEKTRRVHGGLLTSK